MVVRKLNAGCRGDYAYWSAAARLACATLLAVSGLLYGRSAEAFRALGGDERFDRQPVVAWDVATIELQFSAENSPLSSSVLQDVAESSAAAWDEHDCDSPHLRIGVAKASSIEPADGRNTIAWVDDWSMRGFDPSAPAQTELQFEKRGSGLWQIVEADIYLNAADFQWGESGSDAAVELGPVLLHELGHVLGLLHPCGDDAPSIPACGKDPAFDVVMNPAYSVERSMPVADDLAGICTLYGQHVPLCTGDADCPAARYCNSSGACVAGTAPEAAPCSGDRDCASGLCANEVCALPCSSSMDCPSQSTCSVEAEVGVCVSVLRPIGESCSQSEECASQKCVIDQHGTGFCTLPCTMDDVCPQHWKCGAPQAEQVCIPGTVQAAGGGCKLTPQSPAFTDAWPILIAGLCLLRRRSGKRQC
jgi:hypothetical protein